MKIFSVRTIPALLCLLSQGGLAQVALFDFQNAWEGFKQSDFSIVAGNSPSSDLDADSVVSLLSNNGFTAGGFGSYSLDNPLFATSATPTVGLNLGGANQSVPTNYISFSVTPEAGIEKSYSALTLYSDTSGANDEYTIQLRVIDGGGDEQILGTQSFTTGASNNEPVRLVTFDFANFSSTDVTEWRLYGYNADVANNGIRFDDITLEEGDAPAPVSINYRVYFLGGQSNASGRGNAAELTDPLASEQADVALYMHTTLAVDNLGHLLEDEWIYLAPGSGHGRTNPVSAIEFGSELSFGRQLADAQPLENIAIVKYTHGGSNLHTQWSATGDMYATFVQTAEESLAALTAAGHTYDLAGMIWHQGEADTSNATNAGNYEANLRSLIARVRTDVFEGKTLPFIVAGLSDSQYPLITTSGRGEFTVRQAQERVAENGLQVGFVNTDGFAVRPTDTIHLNTEGQIALGEGFAQEMLLLEGLDADADGLTLEQEAVLGTDPDNFDTDGDGDSDGLEFLAGTDPADGSSFFAVREISLSGDEVTLSWPSRPGNLYRVEQSMDLRAWSSVITGIEANATGGVTSWTGAIVGGDSPLALYNASAALNGDFNTSAFDSVDTDGGSSASRLAQGGSLTGGGASNFVLGNGVFDTSSSGSPGFNFGGVATVDRAAAIAAGDFLSFTTGGVGGPVTYEQLSFFANQFGTGGQVDVSYTVLGVESFILENLELTVDNEPVVLQELDFADFTTSEEVTWTLYLYGAEADNFGSRLDDIMLIGQSPVTEVSSFFYRVVLLP